MTQRTWNGTAQGRYLDNGNWTNGAPAASDTWLIDGAGDAPSELQGIYFIQNNPLVDLYGPDRIPVLIGDPDPSLVPKAAAIVSPDIVVAAGKSVVGFELIDSTIASSTTIDVTGIAVMQAAYSNELAGTISVRALAGAAADSNGNNGELDIQVFAIGSVDPATFTRRDYTPFVENKGTIAIGAGSGLDIGMEGATPELNNVGGIEQVLGGFDAFVNTGTIALADSSMQVQAGFFAGEAGYNVFLNDGVISLGPANPAADTQDLNNVVPGSAFFDAQISGTGTIELTGQGSAQAGAEFLGGVTNTIVIADATASFFNAGSSTYVYTGSVVFADDAGSLSLPLGNGQPFLPISGFRAGDKITIRNAGTAPVLAWNPATHVLSIEDNFGGGLIVQQAFLTIEGSYRASDFKATSTNADITVTTDVLACFAAGTRIATPDGDVAIEHLAPGDLVSTQNGQARAIIWAGRRHIDCDRHAEPDMVRPVRVRAGALAPGKPVRDLLLSPDHALFLDGLLIPVRLLVNDRTIVVAHEVPEVTYHHIELDTHDVILAEGAPAETFLDTGHRSGFADGAEKEPMARFDAHRSVRSCAPFAVDAARVEPVWRRLAGRSPVSHMALTAGPALGLLCDGVFVPPAAIEGEIYRFDVRGPRTVRLVSRAMRPSDRLPWLDDRRMLGIQVRSIVAYGVVTVPVDRAGTAAGRGWHADEPGGRWTDGDAELTLPDGTTALELIAGSLEGYPLRAPRPLAA